jgi:hypothetical protein
LSTYELQNINAAQRDLLLGFGVQHHPWGDDNVLIDGEDQLELALQVLNLQIAKRKVNQENLISLKLKSGYVPTVHPSGTIAAPVPTETAPAEPRATPVPRPEPNPDRTRYVEICRERLERQINEAREHVKRTTKAFKAATTAFIESMRQSTFAQELSPAEWDARFAEELDRVREMGKVVDVKVTNNGFAVITDTLYATAPDTNKRYEIGSFLIHIRPGGDSAGVFFINRTRRVDGARPAMNAPYVYANGTTVTDDVTEVLMELLGRGEIAAIVDLAIQYIETVQPEHPLTADLNKWPEVVL